MSNTKVNERLEHFMDVTSRNAAAAQANFDVIAGMFNHGRKSKMKEGGYTKAGFLSNLLGGKFFGFFG